MAGNGAQAFRPSGPPHDPTWWWLDDRAGWRAAVRDGLDPLASGLALTPELGSERVLTEASGSFGGLVPPRHVAFAEGELYLLNSDGQTIRRFDVCACRFETLPAIGGEGSGPRQFRAARALGMDCGSLFVCDGGNHRLSVFTLHGLALSAHWAPPAHAALPAPWQPAAIAFDHRHVAWVCDSTNGRVHAFDRHGRWLGQRTGLPGADAIALTREGRLAIRIDDGQPAVVVIPPEGDGFARPERVGELRDAFVELPFQIDREGTLDLTAWCGGTEQAVFDLTGERITGRLSEPAPRYPQAGMFRTVALDSGIHGCTWHRFDLRGDIPSGTRLTVRSYTAEAELPDNHLHTLSEAAWSPPAVFRGQGPLEGLFRSPPGRYLWLRIDFESDGLRTPSIQSARVEFPRISLRRFLPAVFGEDPAGAEFTDRLLALFDTTLRSIEGHIDEQARYFDVNAAPEAFLHLLAKWIGLPLDPRLPLATQRALVKQAARLYPLRGTRQSLYQQLLIYLGMRGEDVACPHSTVSRRCPPQEWNCTRPRQMRWTVPPLILEHFRLRRWLYAGHGRLGDQAVLWGRRIVNRSQLDQNAQTDVSQLKTAQDPLRDPFHVYAHRFSVFVPAARCCDSEQRRSLRRLIEREKPAHTAYQLIEVEPRFRIGVQSMIGLDAVVGRYPRGGRLGALALGRATMVNAAGATRDSTLGKGSIGSATRLK